MGSVMLARTCEEEEKEEQKHRVAPALCECTSMRGQRRQMLICATRADDCGPRPSPGSASTTACEELANSRTGPYLCGVRHETL